MGPTPARLPRLFALVPAALALLGYTVVIEGAGARVVEIVKGMPADGVLHVDDVITSIDGKPVTSAADLAPLIRRHKASESASLKVRRDGKDLTLKVKTA